MGILLVVVLLCLYGAGIYCNYRWPPKIPTDKDGNPIFNAWDADCW